MQTVLTNHAIIRNAIQ